MTEAKIGRCGFNENVLCTKTKCHECGWHPKVAEMRKQEIQCSDHDTAVRRKFKRLLCENFNHQELEYLDNEIEGISLMDLDLYQKWRNL